MRSIDPRVLEGKSFLTNYSIAELARALADFGSEPYRAQQIMQAVIKGSADSFDAIQSLPQLLRAELSEHFIFRSVTIAKAQVSSDGTIKYLMDLTDGAQIETVLIPSEMVVDDGTPKRRTLCISTQSGCPLGCKFCATASLKLRRNLDAAEIIDQLLAVRAHSGQEITNIVFMGMGEPMLNYDNVMKSVDCFTDGSVGILSPKRITLSTAGVVEGILRMADEKRTIKLALSLHATTNGDRQKIMPIALKYSLNDIANALEYYYRATKIPVTYEYILFNGLNNSDLDVRRLQKITRRVPSKVNVIPFHQIAFTNPTGVAAELEPATHEQFVEFIAKLKAAEVQVMIRSSSGVDIDAACGQLAFSTKELL